MVIIKLQGGLGNQMFQYAFGLSVAQKLESQLYFDISFYKEAATGLTPRNYELGLFKCPASVATEGVINSFFNPGPTQKVLNKLGINKKTIYREQSLRFNNNVLEVKAPAYFDGFWQSERYFSNSENLIRKMLLFKKPLNPYSESIVRDTARRETPVSIHIRRGDYISSKTTNEVHGVCSVKYYRQAIEVIKEKAADPHFYFFSDDPEWVKTNLLPQAGNATLVQHNTDTDSWQDMALMSKCKHHIIANSSFSWWGAWLNPVKEKIVIAPKNWFNSKTDYFDDKDLVPETWCRLPNE